MTTEQETGRGAPVRRAVPKTGTRRSATSYQPKPRPRPDTRPETDGKAPAGERERADGKRPVGERADGRRAAGERERAESKRPVGERARPESRAQGERLRAEPKAPTRERTRGEAGGRTPVRTRPAPGRTAPPAERASPARPESGGATSSRPSARPAASRHPSRRSRAPFVLLVVGLLCGGLVSLLLLNTMLAQDAITDASLREQIAVAEQEKEKIEQEYQRKTQPGVIADMADKQGLSRRWDDVNPWTSGTTDTQAGQADSTR
ncbi:hypothetical protein AB0C27_33575 [Nonomuraea sp. NPDC048882]|uniref:hypothetical protein n=1 Tax=Nonomuraea sp. NPDC048882 TaxID=3154347 RepID=UPI0033F7F11F